ncbi:MAG: transcription-repair coupling factor, partial [Candidatus Cloacimonetes bacterium]|nr:transcription-repair coupling factor [Candidatus Cloacimonadota bacterium]
MLGIKDLSLVNVPPANRLPIETEIVAFNKTTIRNAIMRELDRDGQVYFVHNRVQSIDTMRAMLEDLLPEVRFCVGHGQMPDGQLEKVMLDFMHRRYDVLISTMIIESGLDIPNVNTMIVSRADTFGLAQLYQLRGRIGRSHRQAYAYLLTPPAFDMTPVAKKRLYTIGEFTDLGSGFKIAMRDLEIRGAGNILGKEQSGHIATVGYELYNKLLEEAILELKHQEQAVAPERFETRVDLPFNALLPESYIEDP